MFTDFEVEEIKAFLNTVSPDSKVYLGCDSVRSRKTVRKGKLVEIQWFATYTLVVVVHKNNQHGCKIFHTTTTERDYDKNMRRPSYRLMNEVAKVAELYTTLYHIFSKRDVEVHLDINNDPKHGSSCVVQQAVGYIQGITGVRPKTKPEAWAASYCADRGARLSNRIAS